MLLRWIEGSTPYVVYILNREVAEWTETRKNSWDLDVGLTDCKSRTIHLTS